jgi:hypothetical protein
MLSTRGLTVLSGMLLANIPPATDDHDLTRGQNGSLDRISEKLRLRIFLLLSYRLSSGPDQHEIQDMPTVCEGMAFLRAKASTSVPRRRLQTMLHLTTAARALLTSVSVHSSVTEFL